MSTYPLHLWRYLNRYNNIARFIRYIAVGVSTFALDMALLTLIIHCQILPLSLAVGASFLACASVNYLLNRHFVFTGTNRHIATGYGIFLTAACSGSIVTAGGVYLLTSFTPLTLYPARILMAPVVGSMDYLFNLFVNFRVAGHHV